MIKNSLYFLLILTFIISCSNRNNEQKSTVVETVAEIVLDKPDFVFSTARHYESANVVLMLSLKAKGGESVRCVGESGYSFDC
jgi:hypothetical protein